MRSRAERGPEKPAFPEEKVRTRDIGRTQIAYIAAIALHAKTNANGAAGKRNETRRASLAQQEKKESL